MRLFGTDGIRGIAGEALTEELARRVGIAVGEMLRSERLSARVVVGYDTRESSAPLCDALCAGLTEAGCDALRVGVAPTPAIAYLTTRLGAGAGAVISASHNPWEYNGIKVFGHDGKKLTDDREERLEAVILSDVPDRKAQPGKIIDSRDALELYVSYLLRASGASLGGLRLGVDLANGATVATAIRALEAVGAECIPLSDAPSGRNINDGCGSTHVEALARKVTALGLDCGIAFDGDGDRLIAVDEAGREVNGDRILGIIAPALAASGRLKRRTVVGTVMTNPGLTSYLEALGITTVRAKVGDRYVSEMMDELDSDLGGESSGHIIFRELMTTGDGLLTALILLRTVRESGLSLSELADLVPVMPEITVNLPADEEKRSRLRGCSAISDKVKEYGLLLGNKGRAIVRASGTEPCIRVSVSAETEELTGRICTELVRMVEEL